MSWAGAPSGELTMNVAEEAPPGNVTDPSGSNVMVPPVSTTTLSPGLSSRSRGSAVGPIVYAELLATSTTCHCSSRLVALVCASRRSDTRWFVPESTRRLSTTPNQVEDAIANTMPITMIVIITSTRVKPRSSAQAPCRINYLTPDPSYPRPLNPLEPPSSSEL